MLGFAALQYSASGQGSQAEPSKIPPAVLRRAPPEYPFELLTAGLQGEVLVEFILSPQGKVEEAAIVSSNNPYFDQPAIDCVLKWTFKPAMVNGVPVWARMQVPIAFSLRGGGYPLYSIKGNSTERSALPPEYQWDTPPEIVASSFGAYPYELLAARIEGSARARIAIGADGKIAEMAVESAEHPAFASATRALLDTYRFKPAAKEGRPSPALLAVEIRFQREGTVDIPVRNETQEHVRRLRDNPQQYAKLSDLDAPIRGISRRAPLFPSALAGLVEEGNAVVEFVVNREGKVFVPRIVSASHEEFGYAAAQAVATWRFTPPLKDGKRVLALVRQPFNFKTEAK